MADDFLKKMADKQRERIGIGGSTETAGKADDFLKQMADRQREKNEERRKSFSATQNALKAFGDRTATDSGIKLIKPEMVTPAAAEQKDYAQAFPQLPTFGNNVQNKLQQNANKMPLAMQGERSAEVKWQKAAMDLSAAEQKLLSMAIGWKACI